MKLVVLAPSAVQPRRRRLVLAAAMLLSLTGWVGGVVVTRRNLDAAMAAAVGKPLAAWPRHLDAAMLALACASSLFSILWEGAASRSVARATLSGVLPFAGGWLYFIAAGGGGGAGRFLWGVARYALIALFIAGGQRLLGLAAEGLGKAPGA